jgi:hypothetical protein
MLSVEIDILSNIWIISYIVMYFEVLILAKLADGDISARSGFEEITRFSGQYIELLTTAQNSTTELFVQVCERPMEKRPSLYYCKSGGSWYYIPSGEGGSVSS